MGVKLDCKDSNWNNMIHGTSILIIVQSLKYERYKFQSFALVNIFGLS